MTCSVMGCQSVALKKGLCNRHYLRLWRHGDALGGGLDKGAAQVFYKTKALVFAGNDCLIWPFAKSREGYAIIQYGGRCKIVSNMVCEDVYGPPADKSSQAAHSCGNGHIGCVNKTHLRWASYQENRQDMVSHGRSLRGTKNPFAVLNAADVIQIRRMLGVVSQRKIAAQFGVTQSAVNAISTGKTWSWLEA